HHLEQAPKDDGITDVADEQLVETQHADLCSQLTGQRLQRIGRSVELKQAHMHPTHEVMKMLTARRHTQAAVKHVHQPGLAAADGSPEVNPSRRWLLHFVVQCLMAALQLLDRGQLRSEEHTSNSSHVKKSYAVIYL